MADPLADLGPQLARRRAGLKLSVREAAAEAGVPVATFSRVENGRTPDIATFRRLVGWLGVPAETFLDEATTSTMNTPAAIAEHLHADPALDPAAAEQIASLVENMYSSLASRERRIAVHLRAARTFTPLALQNLTSILGDIQSTLEERYER